MAGIVAIPQKTLSKIMRFVRDEVARLKRELARIDKEIAFLENGYGIPSTSFLEMLQGGRKWSLPEGSEPDVVEWEALLEQRRRIEKKLKELEELWRQLQGYSKYRESSRRGLELRNADSTLRNTE